MRVAEALENTNIPNYSKALMSTRPHKNCTNLSRAITQSHDKIYEPFKSPAKTASELHQQLIGLVQKEFSEKSVYLIFDDSQISKPYAKEIEGLGVGFDGSSGKPSLGLQFVSALLSDGDIKLPIGAASYANKKVACSRFVSKSSIAAQLYIDLIELFRIEWVLADAHYATKTFLPQLLKKRQKFLMKIPCNRIVQIGKTEGQLKNIFRLRRNEHSRVIKANYNGDWYYFYVVKVRPGRAMYFVCSHEIDIAELCRLYKIRWNIELFHRVAKQYLGWKDCQMRTREKQYLHTLYVMYAYAIAEIIRRRARLQKTEDAIRMLWDAISHGEGSSIYAAGENLC